MNKRKRAKFFKKLEKEELHARQVLEDDAGDIKDLKSEWQERDSPAERNLRSVEWTQYSTLQEAILEIRNAKERIEDGTFGICEDCESEIPEKRLELIPTARHCVSCQEKKEAPYGVTTRPASL
jgi:DnaK suppressor protein